MITDNIEFLRKRMQFGHGYFYYAFIKVKSETMGGTDGVILKSYVISSEKYLDRYITEIKYLCDKLSARCYVLLNRRSMQRVTEKYNEYVDRLLDLGSNIENLANPLHRVCMEMDRNLDEEPVTIIDLNNRLISEEENIKAILYGFGKDIIQFKIPTLNGGSHLVCRKLPREVVEQLNAMKIPALFNMPTVLYANDSQVILQLGKKKK